VISLKLVRKASRRRYGRAVYESERILISLPAEDREAAKPWLGRDLKIRVRPLSYGFALLVTGGKGPYIDGVAPRIKFRRLMSEMEPGDRADPR